MEDVLALTYLVYPIILLTVLLLSLLPTNLNLIIFKTAGAYATFIILILHIFIEIYVEDDLLRLMFQYLL